MGVALASLVTDWFLIHCYGFPFIRPAASMIGCTHRVLLRLTGTVRTGYSGTTWFG